MAIFLDCYQAQRSMKTVLLWSLAADGACILLVLGLVVLLSRRAIDRWCAAPSGRSSSSPTPATN